MNDQVRLNEKEQPLPVVEQTPEDDPYRYAKGTNPLPARELKTMDREFLAYIDDLTNSKFDFSMMNLLKTAFIAVSPDNTGTVEAKAYRAQLGELEKRLTREQFNTIWYSILKRDKSRVSFIKIKHFLENVESALYSTN